MIGCATPAPPASSPSPPRALPTESTQFPLFVGPVERPVWASRVAGTTSLTGPTRANMDAKSLAYTDVPLMSVPAPCEAACARFEIPPTWRDGSSTRGPFGVTTFETGHTLESPDGIHRAVEWWVLEHDAPQGRLHVTRVHGLFDAGRRAPLGYTTESVDAAPLEAGSTYVFRTCDEGCDRLVGDALRRERLTLIGPGGAFSSASDDPLQRSNEGQFTRVSTRVRPDEADTLTLNYDTASARRFAGVRPDAEALAGVATLMLDVVWLDGEMPELTAHRGLFVDTPTTPDLGLPGTAPR